jgi:hypothetical protein
VTLYSYQHLITIDKTRHEHYLARVTILWFLLLEILGEDIAQQSLRKQQQVNQQWLMGILNHHSEVQSLRKQQQVNQQWLMGILNHHSEVPKSLVISPHRPSLRNCDGLLPRRSIWTAQHNNSGDPSHAIHNKHLCSH